MSNRIELKKTRFSSVVEWARKVKLNNDAKIRKDGNLVTNVEDGFVGVVEKIDDVASVLQNECIAYPEINGLKNYTDSDGVYHKVLGWVDLSKLTWSLISSGLYACITPNNAKYIDTYTKANAICNTYTVESNANVYGKIKEGIAIVNGGYRIYDTSLTSASDINGILFYELATPQTWQSTSLVQNVVGSDAWVSTKSYSANEHFIYQNVLYRVKVACSGITPPNTNYYEVVSLTTLNTNFTKYGIKKLWENTDTSLTTFNAQTITLNNSDYDFYIVVSKESDTMIQPKGASGYVSLPSWYGGQVLNIQRNYTYVDETHLSCSDCSWSNGTISNTTLIPLYILGFKLS